MPRERSGSKAGSQPRAGASASRSRSARPAEQSRPAGKGKASSGRATAASSPRGKRAAGKPAAKPTTPRKAAARAPSSPGGKRAARKVAPAKPAATRKTTATAARAKPSTAALAKTSGSRTATPKDKAKSAPKAVAAVAAPAPPITHKRPADVTDEERVEIAKYITGEQPPPRVFEEERFIFPETYGRTRVRLLVKDPHWLFAHWDVDPAVFAGLRGELGERAAALSRLTLKVIDPEHGGGAVIHLPEDARSWYVRADRVRRAYRAELGITLPSGEYRALAASGLVRPPQGSASHRRAQRRARYAGPRRTQVAAPGWPEGEAEWLEPEEGGGAPGAGRTGRSGGPGPWEPAPAEPWPGAGPSGAAASGPGGAAAEKGGASDVYRPRPSGASDLYRR